MTPDERLIQISQDFDQWRLTRPHRNAETPPALRQAALSLLPEFPVPRVAKSLGISANSLYLWRKPAPQAKSKPKAKPATFVQLPAASSPAEPARSLSLQIAQDLQLTLHGELSAQYLAQLIAGLRP